MRVKEAVMNEIDAYILGRINDLSELARKYAEIDNYAEIARMKELQQAKRMIDRIINRT
ncbi:MAG: hypothetical protein H8E98_01700 [Bacteroidetes bacterium]|nr:hypothetical protein [Bacteroidota bacterium]